LLGETAVVVTRQAVKEKAYHELKEFLLMALYLWIVFGLFTIYKYIILAEHHIDFVSHGLALINALALAKVMLIAKALHLGERANDAPLIYPTLLKSALFCLVLACFKILEETAIGLYYGKSFLQSIANLGGGTWQGMLCLTILLFVVLIPFFGFSELRRVLGEGKLGQIFFCPRHLLNPAMRQMIS
jgi:hypothetical protein